MLLIASILMTIGAILGTLAFIGLGILIWVLRCPGWLKARQEQLKLDFQPGDADPNGRGGA